MAVKPQYYETLYIVRPDIKEEELSKIQQKLNEALAAHEGEIVKSDKWAQRELAYEIKDYSRGVYYIIVFTALPGAVAELERHLRFYNTDVLRFITVAISDNAAKREKAAAESKSQNEPAEAATESKSQSEPAEAATESKSQSEPVEAATESKSQDEPAEAPARTEGES